MRPRSKSRRLALQILYQADVGVPVDPSSGSLEWIESVPAEDPQVREFAERLARGCLDRRRDLDAIVARFARNWDLARMPILDRNVMRLGAWELLFGEEIPPAVVIDEAVELAKRFGAEGSGPFVNGVLDRVRENRDALRLEFPAPAEGACSKKP